MVKEKTSPRIRHLIILNTTNHSWINTPQNIWDKAKTKLRKTSPKMNHHPTTANTTKNTWTNTSRNTSINTPRNTWTST